VNFSETSPDAGQTYLWDFGDPYNTTGSTDKNPVHIYEYQDTYDVTITVTNPYGCSSIWTWEEMITVSESGIEQVGEVFNIFYNPNPFKEKLELNFELKKDDHLNIGLYDIIGNKVADIADGIYNKGEHKIIYNTEDLAGGIYICRIKTPVYSFDRKLLKVK